MGELWWMLTGYVRVRILSGDPETVLRRLSEHCRLRDIEKHSALEVSLAVGSGQWRKAKAFLEQKGARIAEISHEGLPEKAKVLGRYPVVTMALAAVLLLTMWIPKPIWKPSCLK